MKRNCFWCYKQCHHKFSINWEHNISTLNINLPDNKTKCVAKVMKSFRFFKIPKAKKMIPEISAIRVKIIKAIAPSVFALIPLKSKKYVTIVKAIFSNKIKY